MRGQAISPALKILGLDFSPLAITTSSIMLPRQVAGPILLKGTDGERQASSHDFRDQLFQSPQVVRVERRDGITRIPFPPHGRRVVGPEFSITHIQGSAHLHPFQQGQLYGTAQGRYRAALQSIVVFKVTASSPNLITLGPTFSNISCGKRKGGREHHCSLVVGPAHLSARD